MEIIRVPAPPKEAFNKHRPISDLIKAQVKHFKHLEHNLSWGERLQIPQHRITTEGEAAAYIAAMTRFLRERPGRTTAAAKPVAPHKPVKLMRREPAPAAQTEELSIAASGEELQAASSKSRSKAGKSKRKK